MGGSAKGVQRINIQVSAELKAKVERWASQRGESVSTFLRESVTERIDRFSRAERALELRRAYEQMAEENERLAAEHEAVDLEGWE